MSVLGVRVRVLLILSQGFGAYYARLLLAIVIIVRGSVASIDSVLDRGTARCLATFIASLCILLEK